MMMSHVSHRVNVIIIVRSGFSISLSIALPFSLMRDAGWCRLFHHSTENFMMGRLMAPIMARIAVGFWAAWLFLKALDRRI